MDESMGSEEGEDEMESGADAKKLAERQYDELHSS